MSAMAEMMRMKKEKLVEQWSSHLETAESSAKAYFDHAKLVMSAFEESDLASIPASDVQDLMDINGEAMNNMSTTMNFVIANLPKGGDENKEDKEKVVTKWSRMSKRQLQGNSTTSEVALKAMKKGDELSSLYSLYCLVKTSSDELFLTFLNPYRKLWKMNIDGEIEYKHFAAYFKCESLSDLEVTMKSPQGFKGQKVGKCSMESFCSALRVHVWREEKNVYVRGCQTEHNFVYLSYLLITKRLFIIGEKEKEGQSEIDEEGKKSS